MTRICFAVFSVLAFALCAHAGEADVLSADIQLQPDGSYIITVEVEHADDGWDHYADAWEVVSLDGTVLTTRILAHPHVNEHPFIRSKSGIIIPEGVDQVTLRARDLVHGFGGREITVSVPKR